MVGMEKVDIGKDPIKMIAANVYNISSKYLEMNELQQGLQSAHIFNSSKMSWKRKTQTDRKVSEKFKTEKL
ncbi:hypothetical protein Bpfe_027551, partial [Biomphalaria pfeifferi]